MYSHSKVVPLEHVAIATPFCTLSTVLVEYIEPNSPPHLPPVAPKATVLLTSCYRSVLSRTCFRVPVYLDRTAGGSLPNE